MSDEPTKKDLMAAILSLHDDLNRGFGQVDRHFTQVDKRLSNLEVRVTSIEGEVKGINHWMAHTDARFDALERRKGR